MRNYLLVLLLSYTLASPYTGEVYPNKEYYKLPGQLIEQFRRFRYNMKNQGTIARNPGAGVFRYIQSLMNRDRRGEGASNGLRNSELYQSYGARIM